MKRSDGYTFFDAVGALLLLTLVIGWCAPIYLKVMVERQTLNENHVALSLLNNHLNQWVTGLHSTTTSIVKNNVRYQLTWSKQEPTLMKCCVEWLGADGEQHRECGEAKRNI